MYCLLLKFISPNFCQNLYVHNLHDFILIGGGTASPPLPPPRTAIISRCLTWNGLYLGLYIVLKIDSRLFIFDSRLFILDSRLFILDSRLFTLDSRLFTLDSRLFTLDSRLLLSTLDFYSRLSTFTLDSRPLLSTLDPRLLDTLIEIMFGNYYS